MEKSIKNWSGVRTLLSKSEFKLKVEHLLPSLQRQLSDKFSLPITLEIKEKGYSTFKIFSPIFNPSQAIIGICSEFFSGVNFENIVDYNFYCDRFDRFGNSVTAFLSLRLHRHNGTTYKVGYSHLVRLDLDNNETSFLKITKK